MPVVLVRDLLTQRHLHHVLHIWSLDLWLTANIVHHILAFIRHHPL
jgi:hypothetical protein